ncbi:MULTISPECIES: hypothetical protein [unclassified Mesorhizobium]|uniref:hypothetical protein n=1 Tax=unclassified Mesorhizobium TaxID=325217 RepID=UPI000FD52BA2|nr:MULTISPECIES: hypothetical protein [unclassified Mesorhizobium]RUT84829.1 hypothetical protein EOD14_19545 [Mesorhizobium sp. M7A.T.Ca.US.000.02.1.1]RUU88454.1 hypothetical protein EOD03_04805 [Mesorhizobium sp. M7A.T.Ca.TU.009.01.1.2]
MFLEKHSRFFRQYEFTLNPRHKAAIRLPLIADENEVSLFDALETRIQEQAALEVQPNHDIIELMTIEHWPKQNAIVMLFHKASPDAADPAYRKKARAKVTIRDSVKEEGEEQSVSAHLVINTVPVAEGRYRAVLEEIPGMSMGILRLVIAAALFEYKYDFETKNGEVEETYCVFKAEGVKSETIAGALEEGHMNFITLVRPAEVDFVDGAGIFEPINEVMKIRIKGEIDKKNWAATFKNLVEWGKKEGWQDFNIEIDLGDKRKRTVTLDREHEAKEILFVRSEQVHLKKAVRVCSDQIVNEIAEKALALMAV